MDLATGRHFVMREADVKSGHQTPYGTIRGVDGLWIDIDGTIWGHHAIPNSVTVKVWETVFK